MLSVVIPIYNEYGNIPELARRLASVLIPLDDSYEILWVDDHSTDNSLELITSIAEKDHHHKYVSFSRNFGHQIAIMAGIEHASGDAVITIDGDLQDPPELIADLVREWNNGYDVVYARRRKRSGENLFKKSTAFIFYRLLSSMTRIDIPLDTGDFRLIDRKVVDAVKSMPERQKYLRGQIAWTGFKSKAVDYDRDARVRGESNYSINRMIRLAWDGISGFSNIPIKMVSWFGFTVAAISFLLIIYAIVSKFVWGTAVRGWTSLIMVVLFLGGIQLLSIGVIGEYISRIDENIRNRPLYIVDKANVNKED